MFTYLLTYLHARFLCGRFCTLCINFHSFIHSFVHSFIQAPHHATCDDCFIRQSISSVSSPHSVCSEQYTHTGAFFENGCWTISQTSLVFQFPPRASVLEMLSRQLEIEEKLREFLHLLSRKNCSLLISPTKKKNQKNRLLINEAFF